MKKNLKNFKKYIKNILISIIICFTLLNLAELALIRSDYSKKMSTYVLPITEGKVSEEIIQSDKNLNDSYKEYYGENTPSTLLAYYQGYFYGQANIITNYQIVIGASVLSGIVVGVIFTLVKDYLDERKARKSKKV